MEIKVVLDKEGKIVSAIYQTKQIPEEYDKLKPHMGPVVEDGQTLVELGAPDEYASYPLPEFVERLTTDVKAKLDRIGVKQK
jgi:hypothetical protein